MGIIRNVIIGNFVWLVSSHLLPGTELATVLLFKLHVVHGTFPSCSIIGGNPATIIGYRCRDTFHRLSKQNKAI